MIRNALLALVLATAAVPALAQTKVSGEWVTLGDVAPVTGDAAKLLLSPAPPAGETLALDPAFIVAAAKKSGVILALPDAPVLVTRAGSASPVATPKAAPQARQAPKPPTFASQPTDAQVLVFVRDVGRGQRISDADLGWADPETARPGRTPPADLAAAIGLEAKRPLKAGAVVQMADLKEASVVRKGEPVKIVYIAPGLKLSADGIAQSDAALGGGVRVLNSVTKRTIDAVASGEGEARVGK